MAKTILPILLIIGCSLIAQSQGKEALVQQYEEELQQATSDTARVRLLCKISNHAKFFDTEKSKKASEEALQIAQTLTDKYYISMAVNRYASTLATEGQYLPSIQYAQRALLILDADTTEFKNNSSKVNRQLGKIYNQLGTGHDFNSEYSEAIRYYLKAKSVFEASDDDDGLAVSYNNLGISYLYTNDLDKSGECFTQSYLLYIGLGDTLTAYQAQMNIGIVHYYKGEYEKAIGIYKETMVAMKRIGNIRSMGHCISNIGETYAILGQYDSALVYSNKGIQVDHQLNDKEGLGTDYRMRGGIFGKMGNLDSARYYYIKGLEIAKEIDRKVDISSALSNLTTIEKKAGNYKKALEYHEEYVLYNDTIQKESNSRAIGKVEAEHEFNEQLAVEKAENEQKLKLEAQKRKQQSIILYFTLGIIGVILFFVYMLIKSLRQTRKHKELVQEAKAEIEQKNHELLDSIKYAQRIQDALLKDDASLEGLPPHFIFFQPKDIVSGDFYWSYRTDNYWYIAAADCTGHGVPGAMLTMLGTAYLNEICAAGTMPAPGEILDQLKAKITKELSQTGLKGESKDGMDLSLLKVNLKTKKAEWAGANNPLYIISGNDLREIKANKQPIGFSDHVEPFSNHAVPLSPGDSVYLFSDGFADQFGGEKGKKFKYSNFKKLLIDTDTAPADDQKEILRQKFEEWRGHLEQLDDICVIGIRI